MNQEDAGRLALGVGFGAVGALVITQLGLNEQDRPKVLDGD